MSIVARRRIEGTSVMADVRQSRTLPTRGMSLHEIQARFQSAILSGDEAALADMMDNSRTNRGVLFGVYRNAYVGRLVEIIGADHEQLHRYLGDDGFAEMARAYIAAHPSTTQNARWVSRHLPAFLVATKPWSDHPEIVELAIIEDALNTAFDAADGAVIGLPDMAAIAPERWEWLQFSPHPSARRLTLDTNALDIWRAMKDETDPPAVERFTDPVSLLVWRHNGVSKVRALGAEETMMWDEASKGVRFGILCELIAAFDKPQEAASRAAGYLVGWLGAELLAGVQEQAPKPRRR